MSGELAIAVDSHVHLPPFVQSGELWQLPPHEALPTVDIYLVTHSHQPLSQAETARYQRYFQPQTP